MAAEISDRVREIAAARELSESEAFERALERGLEALWEALVLTQYLDGDSTVRRRSTASGGRRSSAPTVSVRSSRMTSTGA